ncbi:head-tail adaptor protein [Oceanicola sp. S124]|uniref:head-tail adaptor protein n=1 Tax=Oceanicola sp. S124 TaxID=1042378 RepID=UPI0002558212|nr:head-tail adaptor protein [Oceanicola sp. S124]
MDVNAAALRRQIQITRSVEIGHDGLQQTFEWQPFGPTLRASRTDVSDAEKMHAWGQEHLLVSRFVVRATAFTRSIQHTDRLVCDGRTFVLDGIKEVPGRRPFLELTARSSGRLNQ